MPTITLTLTLALGQAEYLEKVIAYNNQLFAPRPPIEFEKLREFMDMGHYVEVRLTGLSHQLSADAIFRLGWDAADKLHRAVDERLRNKE